MIIFLNTILKHVLGVSTLLFVIIPFINTMTNGAIVPGAMAANMPSLSSFNISSLMIPAGGAQGFMPANVGGGMYLGGGKPIFLN